MVSPRDPRIPRTGRSNAQAAVSLIGRSPGFPLLSGERSTDCQRLYTAKARWREDIAK
jgi:hypothetical protein